MKEEAQTKRSWRPRPTILCSKEKLRQSTRFQVVENSLKTLECANLKRKLVDGTKMKC